MKNLIETGSYILQVLQDELAKFKSLLLQNGYPQRFIDYCICSFLNKVFDIPIKPLTTPNWNYLIFVLIGLQPNR